MANSLAIQEHVAYFLSGIVEAFRWPTISSIIARSPAVQRTLLKSFVLNGVIYLGILFILEELYDSPSHKIFGYSYASITGYPMYLLCLLANSRYYARTAKEAFNVYTDQATERVESSSMGSLIVMAIFYMNCAAFIALVRSIPVVGPIISFFIQCIITSFYCFDYKWTSLGWSMEQRLAYSEQHWSFFCGFGLPVSGLTFFLSTLRAGGVFALAYPLYIIMATTASVKPMQAVSVLELLSNRSFMLPSRIPVFFPIEYTTRAIVHLLMKFGLTSVQSPLSSLIVSVCLIAYAVMILSRLKQKIAAKRSGSLLESVVRRQKFIRLALKFTPLLSIALFVVGIVWLLLLPYEGYNKRTYISENALLPAQVNVYYGYEDIQTAERYRYEIADVQTKDSETRAKFIEQEFRGMGFASAIQHFTLNGKTGSNAFAIYRAPRSDGKEALILSAPWNSRTGDYNTNGIAALLSLAKLFKKNIYWSKDIIFVVTDQGMAGMQSWIDAYHGTDEKDHASLSSIVMPRSGAIQGAVNLDFPGTYDYESLGIFFEGVNGQLPNLDLINTIVTIADRTARVPLILHDTNSHPFHDGPWSAYFESLFNMLRTMKYQALGHPSSDAGLYLRYKIDAVTVHGIVGSTHLDSLFGFHRIGILIESTFRSLNNLLEHFHQSFFFYLLPRSYRYVSIGMYMPPVILLACGLILQSLVLYYFDPQNVQEISKDAIPPAYSTRGRNLGYAFTVMTLTHIAGIVIFYIMQTRSIQDHIYQFGISVSIATAVVFGTILLITRFSSNDARVLKSFCLALSGLVITTISLLNFSLAVATAVAVSIPYTIIRPTRQWILRLLQLGLLAALSPPGMISILVAATGVQLDDILSIVVTDYHIVNSWLLLYICVAYWPTNMAMQILIFSK